MSQPVKLSDSLVLDARVAGEALQRSIAGQVEFWARLGRSVEVLLNGPKVMQLCQSRGTEPLLECLMTADSPKGRQRLATYLGNRPFPHFQPHPEIPGLLRRIDEDGTVTEGRFVNRTFTPVCQAAHIGTD